MYYNTSDTASVLKNSGWFIAKMSLAKDSPSDGKINILKYKLAKFNLEGIFLGFEDLKT